MKLVKIYSTHYQNFLVVAHPEASVMLNDIIGI